jgi:hypothetical protein
MIFGHSFCFFCLSLETFGHCMGVDFDYNFLFLCLLGIPMDWIWEKQIEDLEWIGFIGGLEGIGL